MLFWSVDPNLDLNPHSLHGACAVVKGEKWSAAKWVKKCECVYIYMSEGLAAIR